MLKASFPLPLDASPAGALDPRRAPVAQMHRCRGRLGGACPTWSRWHASAASAACVWSPLCAKAWPSA